MNFKMKNNNNLQITRSHQSFLEIIIIATFQVCMYNTNSLSVNNEEAIVPIG